MRRLMDKLFGLGKGVLGEAEVRDSLYGDPTRPSLPATEQDVVNHPAHYTAGPIECIDALRSALGPLGFHDYCLGNTMKYVWRYKQTANLDDLKKASVYLNWAITQVEGLK
jgi:hypothetical protein